MKSRNNIFAAAFDYLKRNTDIRTQKELAKRMGVNENTITRILRDYTEVSEDIITKLQTASGCIFNLQWLRGEDSEPMLAEDLAKKPLVDQQPINHSSLINSLLAAKDETIAALQSQLIDKEKIIKAKDEIIENLRHQVAFSKSASYSEQLEKYPFPKGAAEEKTYK